MRFVKIGDKSYKDYTPKTIFPSAVAEFRNIPNQPIDVWKFSDGIRKAKFRDDELYITERLRRDEKEFGRFFQMSRLREQPMFIKEDGHAFMLPLDNALGYDWLTYRQGRFADLMYKLVPALLKKATTDKEVESCLMLLTDYSANPPFYTSIRHDGFLKIPDSVWPKEKREYFATQIGYFYEKEILRSVSSDENLTKVLPNLNATKGLGFHTTLADGSPFKKDDYRFVPKDLDVGEYPNNLVRFNFAPVKLDYISSGFVGTALETFLKNINGLKGCDYKAVKECFLSLALNIHTTAYRTNNGDSVIVDLTKPLESQKLCTKDRDWSLEIEPGVWEAGKLRNRDWIDHVASEVQNIDGRLVFLKKRPIYPGLNGSFTPPFNMMFKAMLQRIEEGPTGFISNRKIVMDRYFSFLSKFSNCKAKAVIGFDRRTSEQFMTDNFDTLISTFPDWFRDLFAALSVNIVPGRFGLRYNNGALPSGAPQTSFLNTHTGAFEMTMLIEKITGADYKVCCNAFLEMIFENFSHIDLNGWHLITSLGTDDQWLCVFTDKFSNSTELQNYLKRTLAGYAEERSLKVEVGDLITTFGMNISVSDLTVNESLVVSKFFLQEHTVNGDACALKMHARTLLLGKFYEVFEKFFFDQKLGSLESYKEGAQNCLRNIVRFGYPVEGFLNEYNPTVNMVMGDYFLRNNLDPKKVVGKYPLEGMKPLMDRLVGYFESYQSWRTIKQIIANDEN